MTEQLLYKKAPITEAIIDIRIATLTDLAVEQLKVCASGEAEKYPNCQTINRTLGRMEISLQGATSATAKSEQIGYKVTSVDGKYVWQLRGDGCTLSRLAPYESWTAFCGEARRLWRIYRDKVIPEIIERVAVRYINRIDIPHQNVDLKEYFRTSPEISADLPQTLSGFFMQLQLPQDDLKSHLLIHQTVAPSDRPDAVSVILDINLFRTVDLPNADEGIWDVFEKLRVRKDEVFEACITDKTRELIR